ncbi:MAG: hypothetical protein ACE5F2_02845, partial [Candidatus Paceibacteria bacterium]
MTKFGKIVFLGIIAIAMVGTIIFLLFDTYENKERELGKLSVVNELITRFKSIDSESDIQTKSFSFRWNDDSGYSILVPSTESFLIAKPRVGCFERDLVQNIFDKELFIAKKVFIERGFMLDITNSSVDTLDDQFYDYIQAYKKDDELCSVVVNPDCSSYQGSNGETAHQLKVSCGNTFSEARVEQIPFLETLELRNKNSIVRIKNQSGQFFEVGVGSVRGGSTAILKKENDNYRILFIGQESPSCSLIDE